jgi:hypothetical protein
MKTQLCVLTGAIVLAALASIYLGKVARAEDSSTRPSASPITFTRENAKNASLAGGTPYSATFKHVVISGRVDKFVVGTTQEGGHTYTGMIIVVRSDQGIMRPGQGVSHFILPSGVTVPTALLERKP